MVWYVGDKKEQLISIALAKSKTPIIAIHPDSNINKATTTTITATTTTTTTASSTSTYEYIDVRGDTLREYRERYGGVSRVRDAAIIGIIVGSMGLTSELTTATVNRLRRMIQAARKHSYVLVMGRLNEAKLCNFPEIDVFCLITNEDVALIPAKTYHVPVITPYELELGLGAYSNINIDTHINTDDTPDVDGHTGHYLDGWSGNYLSNAAAVIANTSKSHSERETEIETDIMNGNSIGNVSFNSENENIEILCKRVKASFKHEWEDEEEEIDEITKIITINDNDDTNHNDTTISTTNIATTDETLVRRHEGHMTLFNAANQTAIDFLKSRTFQGLTASMPEVEEQQGLKPKQGQFGIAADYSYGIDKKKNMK